MKSDKFVEKARQHGIDAMKKVRVENMQSARGNDIANQFIITTSAGQYFQSCASVIAFKPTGKYRNQFTGLDKKETEASIKAGDIVLADLN